jgi:two-component system nitrogen regulation response regulator GlnG
VHKIWVSDDDNAIRVILEESLSSSGFDVKTFSSGDDIVNELKNAKPDLILTDVQMPGMHGYDLLKSSVERMSSHLLVTQSLGLLAK